MQFNFHTATLIIIVIIACFFLVLFLKESKYNVTPIYADTPLFHYASNISIHPPPQKIDIHNDWECTGDNLRLCDVNDALSCEGCMNLNASCINFVVDSKYIRPDGTPTFIPRNKNSTEGYCLALDVKRVTCNFFHGELAIVNTNPKDRECSLLCVCKNPGYIGNTSIIGDCSTPFICDGNVDDINQPIEKINCKCNKRDLVSARNSENIPYCRGKLVSEMTADDFETCLAGVKSVNFVPMKLYHPDISTNCLAIRWIDPCSIDAFTGEANHDSVYTKASDGVSPSSCVTSSPDLVFLTRNRHIMKNSIHDIMINPGRKLLHFHSYARINPAMAPYKDLTVAIFKTNLAKHNYIYPKMAIALPDDLIGITNAQSGPPSVFYFSAYTGDTTYKSYVLPYKYKTASNVSFIVGHLPITECFDGSPYLESQYGNFINFPWSNCKHCPFPWGCEQWNYLADLPNGDGVYDEYQRVWVARYYPENMFVEEMLTQFNRVGTCFAYVVELGRVAGWNILLSKQAFNEYRSNVV